MFLHQPARNRARKSRQEPRRESGHEQGFALLLVFALAASLAIMIYLEVPRVAFERQRDKEALLIDRGEQYARAIELYTRKMTKYPQSMDDLERAQTVRFLRRRYKDPMTGKDEWRLIHMSPSGQYLDSKVHKPAGAAEKEDSGPSILASKIQGVGQTATIISQEGQGNSAALQKHASDRIAPGSGPGSGPGASPGAGSGDQAQNGSPDTNQDPNQPQNNAAQPGQPQAVTPGTLANSARFPFPGQSAGDSQQAGSAQQPGVGPMSPPESPDATNNNASSAGGSTQPPSQAIQAIQSILGGQRPAPTSAGGQTGQGASPIGAGGGSRFGGGLVGVATKVEMEGIRRYKDHSNYSQWEFVFDPNDSQTTGQATGNQSTGTASNAGSTTSGSSFGGMPGGTAPKN